MRTLVFLFVACALVGCGTSPQQTSWKAPTFDQPRDGQAQLAVYGDVASPGLHWVAQPATLARVEALTVPRTATTIPLKVQITHMENGNPNNTVLVDSQMSQAEKEAVSLRHGDLLYFYTEQPRQWSQ